MTKEELQNQGKETESRIHEDDDGTMFVRVDDDTPLESEQGAGSESSEKTEKEKLEAGSGGEKDQKGGNGNKAGEDYIFEGDDVPESYKGKTARQVLDMHLESTDKIIKDGQKIATLEGQVKEANLSPEEIRKRLGAQDLKQLMTEEGKALSQINADLDPDGHEKQAEIVDQLRTEYFEKRQDERLDSQFNNEANQTFKDTHRKTLDDQGFKLSDPQYETALALSENYTANGRLTPDAVQHALIDMLGLDAVTKTISLKAGSKTREDIITAQGKEQPMVNVAGSGRSGRMINVEELVKDPEKFARVRKSLTPVELKKLRKRIESLSE